MAKRKQKIIVKPISPELKAQFEKFIRTNKKDALEAKYRKIASQSIFKTDDDLKLAPTIQY